MPLLPAILLTGLAAQAQIPERDARKIDPPSTDTRFTAKTYKTLAEWQARREFPRKQILPAAGVLPAFPKNHLHAQIFERIECQVPIGIGFGVLPDPASRGSLWPQMQPVLAWPTSSCTSGFKNHADCAAQRAARIARHRNGLRSGDGVPEALERVAVLSPRRA
ncbi:MAG: hypothetical protein ACLQU1_15595 [Bryobacteraceae bacterium]